MSSSKSKARKRQHKPGQLPIERLKRKMEQAPWGNAEFVVEPEGQVKMSEVLERFVDPYLESIDSLEGRRRLFTLAMLAWNASFLPTSERTDAIDGFLGALVPVDAVDVKTGLREIVGALVARKLALFSGHTRKIVDFELTNTNSGLHLAVASTLT